MLVTTKAIVLSKIKYKDNDLIVKCYTEYFGVQSYLIRGVLKSKRGKLKIAYFQELSQLQLVVKHKENRSLHTLNDVSTSVYYQTLHSNIHKSAIAMFLAEVLSTILKEEEENQTLFSFLETAFQWLDQNHNFSNFHLLFLLKLTRLLGFYPETNNFDLDFFNLEEGGFQSKKTSQYCIEGEKLVQLKHLLGTNFDTLDTAHFNSEKRQEFLKMLLLYYELHLGKIKQPRSLSILNQVFA